MNKVVRRILLGLTLVSAHALHGATIVSTFSSTDSYQVCCNFGTAWPTQLGYAFQSPVSSNFIFTGAALALSQGIGSINAVDISLASDASGKPGAILESFHLVNALGPAGANNPPVVVTSALNPVLLAGGVYWLIESPSTAGNGVNWNTALVAPTPPLRAFGDGSGSWTINDVSNTANWSGAFKIFADPVSSSVPEPSTFVSLSLGFALTSSLARRKSLLR